MSDDTQDTIVAVKPCCKRVVFAAVNLPHVVDASLRKEIADLVLEGLLIEHWPVSKVRAAKWGCKCKRIKT